MQSEFGESVMSMNRGADDDAWPQILAALETGATLKRIMKLGTYWVDFDNGHGPGEDGGGRLTHSRVRKLESEGVLLHVGVDRYALASLNATPEIQNG